MRRCLRDATIKHGEPIVIVIDNAPFYSGIEEVFKENKFRRYEVLRLGPYSPFFKSY